jgi:hypothetical protein
LMVFARRVFFSFALFTLCDTSVWSTGLSMIDSLLPVYWLEDDCLGIIRSTTAGTAGI